MRNISLLFICFVCILCNSTIKAQVTIGADVAPNPNAVLELQSDDKGLLLPRVILVDVMDPAPLGKHVEGMMVYNKEKSKYLNTGLYINDGTQWIPLVKEEKSYWSAPAPFIIQGMPGIEGELKKADNPENDYIRSRVVNGKEIEVDFLYSSINPEGASNCDSDYLFSLPKGYSFDLSIHPAFDKSIYGISFANLLPYILKSVSNLLIEFPYTNYSYHILPYNETQFRIIKVSTNMTYPIGWEAAQIEKSNQYYSGRFSFTSK